ncbi:PhzF family phenazine biosynthesis protein [candidate division WOR-3 bacterium]|nr:PhzF family phenazine biosynthesis protein [candidate division WOR-3 bacterium]
MMKKCVFVDVFTDQPYAGNQLAVFPEATGSAAGPLTGYLLKHDIFGRSFEIVNEQGLEMGRPSQIHMRGMLNNGSYAVDIGGQCAHVGQGELVI